MSRHRSGSTWRAATAVFLTFGMLGVGVSGAIPASSAAGDIFQPDALIKLRSDKDYLGDNVYNSDATDQTRIRLSAP